MPALQLKFAVLQDTLQESLARTLRSGLSDARTVPRDARVLAKALSDASSHLPANCCSGALLQLSSTCQARARQAQPPGGRETTHPSVAEEWWDESERIADGVLADDEASLSGLLLKGNSAAGLVRPLKELFKPVLEDQALE